MTRAFIDSASVHGALAALSLGRKADIPKWDLQSLLETTHFLLYSQSHIVPGPGAYYGASGLFSHVVTAFPELESTQYQRSTAEKQTRKWLGRHLPVLSRAWKETISNPGCRDWAAVTRGLFWFDHVRMYGALFNREYIISLSRVLECSTADLDNIYSRSTDAKLVRQWSREDSPTEEMALAEQAWILSSLIRGKYHEFLAEAVRIHLLAHPFRKGIERRLPVAVMQPVLNSEEYFVKTIIGSSLIETTPERRVKSWVEALDKARNALDIGQIALPDARDQADAEYRAAEAAKLIGIPGSSALVRRALDITFAAGFGALLALVINPWGGVLGPASLQLYRHYRGASIGDDIGKLMLSTKWRFRSLARSVPGRIEHRIV